MTNKIAIILVAILVTAITVPTAYAVHDSLKPTDERWSQVCENKLTDGKATFADFSCAVNIYQMFHDINGLLVQVDTMDNTLNVVVDKTSTLNKRVNGLQHSDTKIENTITKIKDNLKSSNAEIDDLESRLQILEGKVIPPILPLTVNVMPHVITGDESFVVYGTADRSIQSLVLFQIHDADGKRAMKFSFDSLQNGGYFSTPIKADSNWTMNGNYTITVMQSNIASASTTINYTMAETP